MLFTALVVLLIVSLAGCAIFRVSPGVVAVVYGLLACVIGFNWLINAAWDRWSRR